MKKGVLFIMIAVMAFFLLGSPLFDVQAAGFSPIQARSACLIDKRTGEMIYAQHEEQELPIASMVKIMTALLTFEAMEKGELTLDEPVCISEQAAGMGGSQMFLDRGLEYPVTDLLKGVIVVSANDACVALAERISGSEESFVALMNARAAELGMYHTHFVNATGLPKEGGHSSARDVAIMLGQLTTHEKYFDYSKIWLEEYKHPDGRTTIFTNTNKFVRFYDECDGGKTGYTSEAKFCLAASATRGDTKLISVVIGADDSKTRFSESKRLLSYGFANYKTEIVLRKGVHAFDAPIRKGKTDTVPCGVMRDLSYLLKVGSDDVAPDYEIEYYDVSAPVSRGDLVGKCTLIVGEKRFEADLIALDDVKKASLSDHYGKILGHWALGR